jgi:hypothetical protein
MLNEHGWLTGNDPSLSHKAFIGSGGTGDVHEVWSPLPTLLETLLNEREAVNLRCHK